MSWAGPESEKQMPTQKPKNEGRTQKQGRAVTEIRGSTLARLPPCDLTTRPAQAPGAVGAEGMSINRPPTGGDLAFSRKEGHI